MSIGSIKNFLNTVHTTANTIGSAIDDGRQILNNFSGLLNDFSNPARMASMLRMGPLVNGTEATTKTYNVGAWSANDTHDWRVRLRIPPLPGFDNSPILEPLRTSNNALVWPLTPQVSLSHSASYTNLTPTHTNYSFPIYQHSQIEDISVSGDFPVENESDGRYWIAAVHFLRSATKMFYGDTTTYRGLPPPVLRFNGYGDFVFKDIPVIVKSFTMELPNGVDYIKVPITGPVDTVGSYTQTSGNMTYVPTLSTIAVTLGVAPSRDATRQFSLDKFINGDYISQGKYI